jgi:hypothetical protein
MWRVVQILGWRWRQPPLIRWLEASALFGVAVAVRFSLGWLHGAIPFLSEMAAHDEAVRLHQGTKARLTRS